MTYDEEVAVEGLVGDNGAGTGKRETYRERLNTVAAAASAHHLRVSLQRRAQKVRMMANPPNGLCTPWN
jgi:hypothetical protein